MTLRLLGHARSINVRKVLWTAAELGLEIAREDWGGGTRALDVPGFKYLNPHAMVPVLVDGAVAAGQGDGAAVVWESNTICRYLAARYPSGGLNLLLPEPPDQRAQVEQWMDWQLGELNPAWRVAFLHGVRGQAFTAEQVQASQRQWGALMQRLDERLAATGAYAAGLRFSLADIVLGLSANRWQHTPISDRPALPHVEAWMARLAQRSAAQQHAFNGIP